MYVHYVSAVMNLPLIVIVTDYVSLLAVTSNTPFHFYPESIGGLPENIIPKNIFIFTHYLI